MSVRVEVTPESLSLCGSAPEVMPVVARAVELGFDIVGHRTVDGEFTVDLTTREPLGSDQLVSLHSALSDQRR